MTAVPGAGPCVQPGPEVQSAAPVEPEPWATASLLLLQVTGREEEEEEGEGEEGKEKERRGRRRRRRRVAQPSLLTRMVVPGPGVSHAEWEPANFR